jgi:tRNA pseudouridine38-40 synthase
VSILRYALKFGYFGKDFSGYARQPDLRTVEGEIIKAQKKTTMILDEKTAKFQSASRTDSRVSACGNVIAFNTDFKDTEIIPALNANLDGIWFYGISNVEDDFNPRHAKHRWYRYYLADVKKDINAVKEGAMIFIGEHDFSNFAKIEEGVNPVRTIDSIEVSKQGNFIILDFKAQSFLWHMIRRIVKAVNDYELGNLAADDIRKALSGKAKVDLGIAEPEPLILMDIGYDCKFEIKSEKLRALKENLRNHIKDLDIEKVIYKQMVHTLER